MLYAVNLSICMLKNGSSFGHWVGFGTKEEETEGSSDYCERWPTLLNNTQKEGVEDSNIGIWGRTRMSLWKRVQGRNRWAERHKPTTKRKRRSMKEAQIQKGRTTEYCTHLVS